MIRISDIKPAVDHNKEELLNAVSKKLRTDPSRIREIKIVKKSLDARDKENIHWNYIIDADVDDESGVLKANRNSRSIMREDIKKYSLPGRGNDICRTRPYIVGSGPAGLFCAYFLAQAGYRPVLIEQGQPVEERIKSAEKFHNEGILNPLSNIQFGEGGAGTFSDGKLNTGVNDKNGRNMLVLETLIQNGAPGEILYENKPHIGTDVLSGVIVNMRKKIIQCKGDVLFNTRFADFDAVNGQIISAAFESGNQVMINPCSILVLAPGNSSRDTFYMLEKSGVLMQAKPFAVGVRAEHLQEDINRAMYGEDYRAKYKLPPADYKLTYKASSGRGVYSFCMCPGGYVINSSSEEGRLCINGMSYFSRDGINSNSAIVVSVDINDTGADKNPLAGIEFQRMIEEKAFKEGGGKIPVQRLGDFMENTVTLKAGRVLPCSKGKTAFADINKILPDFICNDIKEAFGFFGRKIKGFDIADCILSAPETRTSSPVRIIRDEHFESSIKGIFPAGEGAGYAGGITSSAIDGIKVFEEIYSRYRPFDASAVL